MYWILLILQLHVLHVRHNPLEDTFGLSLMVESLADGGLDKLPAFTSRLIDVFFDLSSFLCVGSVAHYISVLSVLQFAHLDPFSTEDARTGPFGHDRLKLTRKVGAHYWPI